MTGTDARESPLLLCARQELTLAVRSRWTQIFAAVFAALSLAVASSGYILSGGSGVQDFARTAASLVGLVLLLVPLTSLVIGVPPAAAGSESRETASACAIQCDPIGVSRFERVYTAAEARTHCFVRWSAT